MDSSPLSLIGLDRRLAGAANVESYPNSTYDSCHHECDAECKFIELMQAFFYLLMLFLGGKFTAQLKMPALVGEILIGIILGPNLANLVPFPEAWVLVGEVGLALLVIEAGLEVDLATLKMIGLRGAAVAVFGSLFPLVMGFFMARAIVPSIDTTGAFIVGASFAPTSMGIALNVLKTNKALNTPTGQLIIAAAILDDIIALMLLSEVDALQSDGSAWAFLQPIVVAILLLVGFGLFAIYVVPPVTNRVLRWIDDKEKEENLLLAVIMLWGIVLAYVVRISGSSHLLGAFIAGLCFCTQPKAHHAWMNQIKRLLNWMLRIFFASTIGFEVPIKNFADGTIIANGFLFFICIVGKLATGIFAQPLNKKEATTVSFAMAAWGEFAFILIVEALGQNIVSEEVFSSVVLAILLSIIFAPIALRATLVHFNKKAQAEVDLARAHGIISGKGEVPLYFFAQICTRGHFGEQGALLRAIDANHMHIIDMRTFHPQHSNTDVQIVYMIYLRDDRHSIPGENFHNPNAEQQKMIEQRCTSLHRTFLDALENSSVKVGRWHAHFKETNFKKGDSFTGEETREEDTFHEALRDSFHTGFLDNRDAILLVDEHGPPATKKPEAEKDAINVDIERMEQARIIDPIRRLSSIHMPPRKHSARLEVVTTNVRGSDAIDVIQGQESLRKPKRRFNRPSWFRKPLRTSEDDKVDGPIENGGSKSCIQEETQFDEGPFPPQNNTGISMEIAEQ